MKVPASETPHQGSRSSQAYQKTGFPTPLTNASLLSTGHCRLKLSPPGNLPCLKIEPRKKDPRPTVPRARSATCPDWVYGHDVQQANTELELNTEVFIALKRTLYSSRHAFHALNVPKHIRDNDLLCCALPNRCAWMMLTIMCVDFISLMNAIVHFARGRSVMIITLWAPFLQFWKYSGMLDPFQRGLNLPASRAV